MRAGGPQLASALPLCSRKMFESPGTGEHGLVLPQSAERSDEHFVWPGIARLAILSNSECVFARVGRYRVWKAIGRESSESSRAQSRTKQLNARRFGASRLVRVHFGHRGARGWTTAYIGKLFCSFGARDVHRAL